MDDERKGDVCSDTRVTWISRIEAGEKLEDTHGRWTKESRIRTSPQWTKKSRIRTSAHSAALMAVDLRANGLEYYYVPLFRLVTLASALVDISTSTGRVLLSQRDGAATRQTATAHASFGCHLNCWRGGLYTYTEISTACPPHIPFWRQFSQISNHFLKSYWHLPRQTGHSSKQVWRFWN